MTAETACIRRGSARFRQRKVNALNAKPHTTDDQAPARRPFDSIWWARRGTLIVAVLVIIVFGSEATLATQRRRDVSLSLSVQSAQTAHPAAPAASTDSSATAGPSPTPTPIPAVIQLLPTDRLSLLVRWHYHIGPRFPRSTIAGTVSIDGRAIGNGDVLIDCGAAVIDCSGQQAMTLAYTVPDLGNGSGPTTYDWASGDYLLIVTRSEGGLSPIEIGRYNFHVQ